MSVTYDEAFGPFYSATFRRTWKIQSFRRQPRSEIVPACPGIYALEFDDGSIYIGSSMNLLNRCNAWHSRGTRSRKITLMRLATRCQNKFTFRVLASSATITKPELLRLEKEAIKRAKASGAKLLNTQCG